MSGAMAKSGISRIFELLRSAQNDKFSHFSSRLIIMDNKMNNRFRFLFLLFLPLTVSFFSTNCSEESFSKNNPEEKKLRIFYSSDFMGQMIPCG
jgi:hypothetical protein